MMIVLVVLVVSEYDNNQSNDRNNDQLFIYDWINDDSSD